MTRSAHKQAMTAVFGTIAVSCMTGAALLVWAMWLLASLGGQL